MLAAIEAGGTKFVLAVGPSPDAITARHTIPTRDPATTLFGAVADPVAMMRMFAPKVEGHVLDGVGHWTQQERPEEVNPLLVDWLRRL